MSISIQRIFFNSRRAAPGYALQCPAGHQFTPDTRRAERVISLNHRIKGGCPQDIATRSRVQRARSKISKQMMSERHRNSNQIAVSFRHEIPRYSFTGCAAPSYALQCPTGHQFLCLFLCLFFLSFLHSEAFLQQGASLLRAARTIGSITS